MLSPSASAWREVINGTSHLIHFSPAAHGVGATPPPNRRMKNSARRLASSIECVVRHMTRRASADRVAVGYGGDAQ